MTERTTTWQHAGTMSPAEALTRARKTLTACLLCGARKLRGVGAFIPRAPELWGGTVGTLPTLWYGLCQPCFHKNRRAGGALVDEACVAILAQQAGTRH